MKNTYIDPRSINEISDSITIPPDIPTGDMPEDRITITDGSIKKAKQIFPSLYSLIKEAAGNNPHNRAVVSIYGGSGSGKSSIASVLSYMLTQTGINSYIISGDNYPKRIPSANDNERLHIYRLGGIRALVKEDILTPDIEDTLNSLRRDNLDADEALCTEYGWMRSYLSGGTKALKEYIGSDKELDFDEVNDILAAFLNGSDSLWLKRMGRDESSLWYEQVDMSETGVLILEWTHGNSDCIKYTDIPVLLYSTPEETLKYRRQRGRDSHTDSPFTALVLNIEQELLNSQAHKAKLIVLKDGTITDYGNLMELTSRCSDIGPMLNAYPDSIGKRLEDMVNILKGDEFKDIFSSFYILPSIYNSDLDRGFSVIDYGLNRTKASEDDLNALKELGISLKLDFILNHASVLSPQFRDLLKNGKDSEYADFFINWNKFWDGYGEMTSEGYIKPDDEYIKDMFFRKPGLPILMVKMPDDTSVPYWNTFYQETYSDDAPHRELMDAEGVPYLGQMDLNIRSELVWDFYRETLKQLKAYGAGIVRLDAFAYAPKAPGRKNFLNEPETWDVLERVKSIASGYGLKLLPEIHATYSEGIYDRVASRGYMTYDFFLPGLLIHAIENHNPEHLVKWANEIIEKGIRTVNMLGCHDGIPLLDLKGLLSEDEITALIDLIVSRGGYVKDLHGKKNMYYQVNATYYSALGESDKKLLFARAVQLFMPGRPQVWYLDLFVGKNDYDRVAKAGSNGHKEINRTNLTTGQVDSLLKKEVVKEQLHLLKLRKTHPAFNSDSIITVKADNSRVNFTWKYETHYISLSANFDDHSYAIESDSIKEPG